MPNSVCIKICLSWLFTIFYSIGLIFLSEIIWPWLQYQKLCFVWFFPCFLVIFYWFPEFIFLQTMSPTLGMLQHLSPSPRTCLLTINFCLQNRSTVHSGVSLMVLAAFKILILTIAEWTPGLLSSCIIVSLWCRSCTQGSLS